MHNSKKEFFIIDFDSTLIQVEALDVLAEIALKNKRNSKKILDKIHNLTLMGMNGNIPFSTSLEKRLELFQPKKADIFELIKYLDTKITPSIERNREFFTRYKDNIYIISGGFEEYIAPLFTAYGLDSSHILANKFKFNSKQLAIGFDKNRFTAQEDGKSKQIRALQLSGKVYIIGDGFTDFEVKKSGAAAAFYVFIENVFRKDVVKLADYVLPNFDEFLYMKNLPRKYSYPKNRIKVLLLENIHSSAISRLNSEGYELNTLDRALSVDELQNEIRDISILGIRSQTALNELVLNRANKLLAVGAFCIGTNHIDHSIASKRGIPIFNAPYSNTRSVVELAIGEIIMLQRKIFEKSLQLHSGIWGKSAAGSHEIRGKKLGIVGYGHIGSQLSILAENLGMEVYFFDTADVLPLGNANKCETLTDLLNICDVITIHVDGRSSNKNLIAKKEFSEMKKGVLFINLSRGNVVDIDSLAEAIKSGQVSGAAVDVFESEPKGSAKHFESKLQGLPNVIITPHIAGSTEEAQRDIGNFVANKLVSFVNTGNTTMSVNFPQISLPDQKNAHRLLHTHHNIPGILAKINNVFAKNKINIEGQYLKTSDDIGYLITDVEKTYDKNIIINLNNIPETIKVRVLY